MKKANQLKAFLIGGLLPLVAFTIIEEYYGTLAGLVAGMAFGIFEILWELKSEGRVQAMTWGANALVLVLGGVSLFTQEGVWFKLQPALLEGVCAAGLFGSLLLKRNILWNLALKQQKQLGVSLESIPDPIRAHLQRSMQGMTFRLGVFLAVHAALATWAALRWSTASWALLKGVGFTGSLFIYLGAEGYALRARRP